MTHDFIMGSFQDLEMNDNKLHLCQSTECNQNGNKGELLVLNK